MSIPVAITRPSAAIPPEAPLDMPVQDFGAPHTAPRPRQREGWRVWLARLIAFGGTAALAVIGFSQMLQTFGDKPTPMQWALLVLFVPTFAWVGFSFCGLIAGLLAPRLRTPHDPNTARVAVIMPIYHEDAAKSIGLLTALAGELAQEGMAERTEIFVLSDSRDPSP